MHTKPFPLIVAGMVAAIFMSAPVFAAKVPLSDDAIAEISGSANNTTFGGNSSATASSAGGANSNSLLAANSGPDVQTSDQNQNYAANNHSGSNSQVQQNIHGLNNALSVGAISQNAVVNSGGSVGDTMNVMGYAIIARRDF